MIDIKEYFKKNRKYAICSVTAMAVLGASCFAGVNYRPVPAEYQQEILAENEISEEEKAAIVDDLTSKLNVSEKDVYKDETVYAFADASGSVDNIVVSEWLRNPDKKSELVDKTNLKDIENVKGDEAFSQSGDTITWQANGNDIYYQGTTNKELPVEVKLTYFLDGKEVKADDLAGKSGKVTIRFDYTNNTAVEKDVNGKKEEVSVPFIAISGLILDENAKNIEVTNGKTMPQGGNTIVIGYAVPGLKDSLDIDDDSLGDLEVPEYVEVSADVKDFKLDMTMTAVVSASEFNMDGGLDTSELDDMIEEMSDAGDALVDGSAQLADGTATLLANMGDFKVGADQLASGASQVSTGASSLAAGASQLATGANSLKDGMDTLVSSSDSLATGVSNLNTGAGQLKTGMDSLVTNTDTLAAGVNSVNDGAQAINTGVDTLNKGLNTPMTAEEATAYQKQASDTAVKAATAQLADGTDDFNDIVENAKAVYANETSTTATDISTNLTTDLSTTLYYGCAFELWKSSNNGTSTTDFMTYLNDENNKATITEEVAKKIGLATKDVATSVLTTGTTAAVKTTVGVSREVAKSTAASVASETIVKGVEGAKANISKQINDGGLVKGASELAAGTATLAGKMPELTTGVGQLSAGATQLAAGTQTLADKVPSLTAGVSQLSAGADQLATGSSTLAAGTNQLVTGSSQLADGSKKLADGSSQIADGVQQLSDGASELSDGMTQFNEQAIRKIVDAYNGDIKGLAGRLEAVMEASSEYQTFTDINDGDAGITKFIIRTNGITE